LGETSLAHRPKDMVELKNHGLSVQENYGVPYHLHGTEDLAALGMAGRFYGGMKSRLVLV
jgi:hypothetical protein